MDFSKDFLKFAFERNTPSKGKLFCRILITFLRKLTTLKIFRPEILISERLRQTKRLITGAIICGAVIWGATSSLHASVISPDEALQRLQSSRKAAAPLRGASHVDYAFSVTGSQGDAALYVYNLSNGGSLILSASDAAAPLLGYTDGGILSEDSLNPSLKTWMESCALQIENIESSGISMSSSSIYVPEGAEYIAPMVKTRWNQMAPYNLDLPNKNYATGCVATAMAQIMKYWEYPAVGHGTHTYTFTNPFMQEETCSIDFAAQPFAWEQMLDTYTAGNYTEEQADAVAYLMKACGYATDMVYNSSSGTRVELVATALPEFFGYDASIQALKRNDFSASEWTDILYNQLKTVGPVLYHGNSLYNLAHAFVCDGFDGEGYFHINWGWSGLSDGFFLLDALNPPRQSTGGSNYGGYNFSQGMIVNIKKSEGTPSYEVTPALTMLGNVTAALKDNLITISLSQANPGNIINNSSADITPLFAFGFATEDGKPIYTEEAAYTLIAGVMDEVPEIPLGSYLAKEFGAAVSLPQTLSDGRYKVTLLWKNGVQDTEWHNFIISPAAHDFFYLSVSGGKATVENLPINRFIIEKAEVITPLYSRNPCEIKFTLTNPSDFELTQSVIPLLYYNGTLSFEGNTQLVSVPAASTIETVLVCKFTGVAGGTSPTPSRPREYTVGAFDYCVLLDEYYSMGEFGDAYYGDLGTVTMYSPGNDATFINRGISIGNASEESVDNDFVVYGIDNFSDIRLEVKVEGQNAFLASPLYVSVYPAGDFDSESGVPLAEKTFESLIYVLPEEIATASTSLKMTSYNPAEVYEAVVSYMNQNEMFTLGSVRFAASSGVDAAEISTGQIRSWQLYNLQGLPVCEGLGLQPVLNLDSLPVSKGIYIIKIVYDNGKTEISKIYKTR